MKFPSNVFRPDLRSLSRRDALRVFGLAGAATALGCGSTALSSSNASGGEPASGGSNSAGSSSGGSSSGGVHAGGSSAGGAPGSGGSTSLPPCIVRPTQTEGPYFVDERLNRSDIRSDPTTGAVSAGALLSLAIRVHHVVNGACAPVVGATVDLWQCNALGVYSDVIDSGGAFNTTGQQFLRGYQVTDSSGVAQFLTIYPGWYTGRTVHLHFKIRTDPSATTGYQFTSQLYFDDATTDAVMKQAPYNQKTGTRVLNAQDGIFVVGGSDLLLAVTSTSNGYSGAFDIGLDIP